jgi:hypothetical protein
MDQTTKTFNFIEGYFNFPDNMKDALKDNLERMKAEDLQKQTSQLYRLFSLKNKLKKCLTSDLACDIKASIPDGVSNKDGRIFFTKIVSNTFSDKEAHKHITTRYGADRRVCKDKKHLPSRKSFFSSSPMTANIETWTFMECTTVTLLCIE